MIAEVYTAAVTNMALFSVDTILYLYQFPCLVSTAAFECDYARSESFEHDDDPTLGHPGVWAYNASAGQDQRWSMALSSASQPLEPGQRVGAQSWSDSAGNLFVMGGMGCLVTELTTGGIPCDMPSHMADLWQFVPDSQNKDFGWTVVTALKGMRSATDTPMMEGPSAMVPVQGFQSLEVAWPIFGRLQTTLWTVETAGAAPTTMVRAQLLACAACETCAAAEYCGGGNCTRARWTSGCSEVCRSCPGNLTPSTHCGGIVTLRTLHVRRG
jgi:hypothetical protein